MATHNRTKYESSQARQAWADFVALGPGRTLTRLWALYESRKDYEEIPCSNISGLRRWSSSFDWRGRIARMEQEQSAELERTQIFREQKARQDHKTELLVIVERLRARGLEMLKYPLVEVTRTVDGKTTIMKPARWTAADVPRYIETADRLLRLALEMPTGERQLDIEQMIRSECRAAGLSDGETEEAVRQGLLRWEQEMQALGLTGKATNMIENDPSDELGFYRPQP